MVELSSDYVEKKLISMYFIKPLHVKSLSVSKDMFSIESNRTLFSIIKKYVKKYKNCPTVESIKLLAESEPNSKVDALSDAMMVLDSLPKSKLDEYQIVYDKAINFYLGRGTFDIGAEIKEAIESSTEVNFKLFRKKLLNRLLNDDRSSDEKVKRGFVYENVNERFENYKKTARGVDDNTLVKFGIKPLDDQLGGMKKSFVSLMYSKTGGGKTRTALSIAYNNASLYKKNVVYFTLEMAFDVVANCFDSRLAWIDSNEVLFGKLGKKDLNKFKRALVQQVKDKLGIWLVDISDNTTTADIVNELSVYRSATGLEPDLVVVDYANLVEPLTSYGNRSEKYDYLFKEFKGIARSEDVALLTATQEKREKSEEDIKNKKDSKDTEGVHNIGLSNYIAPHCELVIRLKQDKFDLMQNILWASIDKYRFGALKDMIKLVAIWDKSYVGDRLVPGTGIKIKKENN